MKNSKPKNESYGPLPSNYPAFLSKILLSKKSMTLSNLEIETNHHKTKTNKIFLAHMLLIRQNKYFHLLNPQSLLSISFKQFLSKISFPLAR